MVALPLEQQPLGQDQWRADEEAAAAARSCGKRAGQRRMCRMQKRGCIKPQHMLECGVKLPGPEEEKEEEPAENSVQPVYCSEGGSLLLAIVCLIKILCCRRCSGAK